MTKEESSHNSSQLYAAGVQLNMRRGDAARRNDIPEKRATQKRQKINNTLHSCIERKRKKESERYYALSLLSFFSFTNSDIFIINIFLFSFRRPYCMRIPSLSTLPKKLFFLYFESTVQLPVLKQLWMACQGETDRQGFFFILLFSEKREKCQK